MGLQSRLYLLSLLLPASLLLGLGASAEAQNMPMKMDAVASAPSAPMVQSRWSDPASWPDGKVPQEGDAVTIGRDKDIVLDVSPPTLRSLTIDGKLSFSDDCDLELKTDWIYLPGGELDIGSEAHPHTRNATITLTDNVPGENINTMGDRGIMLLKGTLSLHGDRKHSWTKLSRTAKAGSTEIRVLDASGWRKGDVIVLASTDFDSTQAEKRTLAAVDGNVLKFDEPLKFMHFGEITYGVDERGEVGMLTRNIRIQASDDAETSHFGGHIMAMAGSKMYVSGVELNRMGQYMHLARYPIHWHLLGEGAGQYIEDSSIHDTYSRCVTVHGTNDVRVENNVTYNNVGHCFFLEDAVEHGNQFIHNLGIMTKCHPDKPCNPTDAHHGSPAGQKADDVLIPSDNTVSTFWITNPDNIYRDNVAAGSEATGFWIALPEHPTGAFKGSEVSAKTWPRRTALREFSGNVSHSNYDALMFDRGPAPDGTFNVGGNTHLAYADPSDIHSKQLETVIDNFTGYKNRNAAIWARGEDHVFKNMKLADNAIGYTHAFPGISPGGAAFTSKVVDSLFVGETDNIGNPRTPAEIAYGRSQPNPNTDYPIRGYEYYDFGHQLINDTFVNYKDNKTREAGAISYLLYSNFPISTYNSVERLHFENAKPVDFPRVEPRWAFETGDEIGYTGAVFEDKDGSIGGKPGSYIVIDNGIASDSKTCKIERSWGAAICQGDFGRLTLRATDGKPPTEGRFARYTGGTAITLTRNGRTFVTGKGVGFFGPGSGNTTIPSGAEVRADTESSALDLGLTEMDKGSWVIFELPGFKTASTGAKLASLDALRHAGSTSYYSDGHELWVKLVVAESVTDNTNRRFGGGGAPGFGGGTSTIQVSK
jgi:cell migration-inducing and hyaluronan-binding protein